MGTTEENTRRGYLPLPQYDEDHESIDTIIKKLNVKTSIIWEGMMIFFFLSPRNNQLFFF